MIIKMLPSSAHPKSQLSFALPGKTGAKGAEGKRGRFCPQHYPHAMPPDTEVGQPSLHNLDFEALKELAETLKESLERLKNFQSQEGPELQESQLHETDLGL